MPPVGRLLVCAATVVHLSQAMRSEEQPKGLEREEHEEKHHEEHHEEDGGVVLKSFWNTCDSRILQEICLDIFDPQGTIDSEVGMDKLTEVFASCRPSMGGLWNKLQLNPAVNEKVSCSGLCQKVSEALAEDDRLPPKSDLGCYFPSEGEAMVCDIDVRPQTVIDDTRFHGDLENYHEGDRTELKEVHGPRMRIAIRPGCEGKIDYPVEDALRKVANLFRIFPPTAATVNEEIDVSVPDDFYSHDSVLEMTGADCAACESWDKPTTDHFYCNYMAGPNSVCYGCAYCKQFNGTGYTSSTGYNTSGPTTNPCTMRFEDTDVHDEYSRSVPGFSVIVRCDKEVTDGQLAIGGYSPLRFDGSFAAGSTFKIFTHSFKDMGGKSLQFSFRVGHGRSYAISMQAPSRPSGGYPGYGIRGAYDVPAPTPMPTPRPTPAPTPAPVGAGGYDEAWKRNIQQVNIKAIAYIETALRKFAKEQTTDVMEKWYGRGANKASVSKILNSVSDMLGNVEYAMGPQCKPNTYAYVYPKGYMSCTQKDVNRSPCTKNDRGQFIFYICQLTLDSELSVQIETLTHEGSHHATSYTDDVDFEGGTAYGRDACTRLAASDSKQAVKNADNFCYYVQDVTDGLQG